MLEGAFAELQKETYGKVIKREIRAERRTTGQTYLGQIGPSKGFRYTVLVLFYIISSCRLLRKGGTLLYKVVSVIKHAPASRQAAFKGGPVTS